jgi:hypothetical protein
MHIRRSCQVFRIGNLAEPQAGEAKWSVQEIASTFTAQRLEECADAAADVPVISCVVELVAAGTQ